MTAAKKALTPEQVREVAKVLGVEADDRVWVIGLDPQSGDGAMDVLAADDTAIMVGEKMYLDSYVKYPSTGTIQATIKLTP